MLFRKIEDKLYKNYNDKSAKILIVSGARQIGKSFIIRETAKKSFKNYIEINLKDDFDSEKKYEVIKDTLSFYLQLSSDFGSKLGNIDDTIVFLDEIQVYPHLISMLKTLKKENKFRYIASGSLLGVTLKHTFIPMGSVDLLKMYPLDFEEFLIAKGVGIDTIKYLKKCYLNLEQIKDNIHISMMRYFREYLISGGLPDSINYFIRADIFDVRNNQNITYEFYKDDASKYDSEHNLKIRNIYDYLPSYMENKVKRIKFNKIENKLNLNLISYQDEFDYLISSGIVLPALAVTNPKFPLMDSMSKNLIKLYYNDLGLLSNILFKNNIKPILYPDKNSNLGSLYETFAAMELAAHDYKLYYFDSKKVGEVDFLINDYELSSPVAIEIKSGNDPKNFRAIPKLVKPPYNLKRGYVFSNNKEIKLNENLIYLPIYLIMFL